MSRHSSRFLFPSLLLALPLVLSSCVVAVRGSDQEALASEFPSGATASQMVFVSASYNPKSDFSAQERLALTGEFFRESITSAFAESGCFAECLQEIADLRRADLIAKVTIEHEDVTTYAFFRFLLALTYVLPAVSNERITVGVEFLNADNESLASFTEAEEISIWFSMTFFYLPFVKGEFLTGSGALDPNIKEKKGAFVNQVVRDLTRRILRKAREAGVI